jgi:hypothetical protein
MENHVGAVWYFIHDYNAQQSKGLSRYHYYRITTEIISLLAKSEKYPSDRYLPANEPLLRPVREIILGKRRFLWD